MEQTQMQELQNPLIAQGGSGEGLYPLTIPLEELKSLFQPDGIREGTSLKYIHKQGGMVGLEKKLRTTMRSGIDPLGQDIMKRVKMYGSNQPIIKEPATLYEIVMQNFEDPTLKILVAAAVVSLVLGTATEGLAKGWIQGFSIMFAVVIVVSVASFNNYMKEKQFQKLNQVVAQKNVAVIRNGKRQVISVSQLVVGDIAVIETGEVLTVDGIIFDANRIQMDQSSITGESHLIQKHDVKPEAEFKQNDREDPFLISGSRVIDGTGFMIVLVVGKNSRVGISQEKLDQDVDTTPLQQKLEVLAEEIGAIGIVSATLTFAVLIIHLIFKIVGEMGEEGSCVFCAPVYKQVLRAFILAVTIIVMAVPQGLPLAVTIALAYSVGKMKDENNLVRYIQACETMGGANNICSDKTGTLTKNVMSVAKTYIQGNAVQRLDKKSINQNSLEMLCLGICVNSNACPTLNQFNVYEQTGNKTECALLELALNLGYDYKRYRTTDDIKFSIPFNSARKKMTTVYKYPRKDKWILFSKGAPEFLMPHCKYFLSEEGKVVQINQEIESKINNKISSFANDSLRTLLLAYSPIENPNQINPDKLEDMENDMIVIAIVGIKDPLRKEIPGAVEICKKAGIVVRMVTGDNTETAIAIAKDAGILPANYIRFQGDENTPGRYVVLQGKEFRTLVGGLETVGQGEDQKQVVKNIQVFAKISKQLRVLARSSPTDKYLLATGLKQLNNVVAMTGDGTNDAPALKKADIGFAMGIAGTQVAKEAAGIILLDDNFNSIITAIKYGRNIFDCIRKFLQFQLTVNIVAISIAFIGAVFINESPLNAVQMLWVNLIMDTLAALALATDPPSNQLLQRMPYSRKQRIIMPSMWRFIILNACFQIVVNAIILFKGDQIFGVPNQIGQFSKHGQEGVADRRHFTIFFNVFIFLTVFNFFNARTLKKSQFNPFANLCNNPIFVVIVFSLFVMQIVVVQFGGEVFKLQPLTMEQHIGCVLIGSLSLLFNILSKTLLPESCLNSINAFHSQEKKPYDVDRILRKIFKATVPERLGSRKSVAIVRSRRGSASSILYNL